MTTPSSSVAQETFDKIRDEYQKMEVKDLGMASPSTSVLLETLPKTFKDGYQKMMDELKNECPEKCELKLEKMLEDLMEEPMERLEENTKRSKLEGDFLEQQKKTMGEPDKVSGERQKRLKERQKTMYCLKRLEELPKTEKEHQNRLKELQKTMEERHMRLKELQKTDEERQKTLEERQKKMERQEGFKERQKTLQCQARSEELTKTQEERLRRLEELLKTKEERQERLRQFQKTFKRPKRLEERAPKIRLDEHERRSEDEEGEKQSLVDLQKKKLEWPRLEQYTERPQVELSSKPNTKEKAGSSGISTADGEDNSLQSFLSKFHHTIGDSKTSKSSEVNFSTLRFAAGVFDKRGGHLTLEHLGIDLYVPPDAVSDANTEIFLYAREAEEPAREEDGKRWKPPVIQCGPHGLTFNRHVILTVKHPAKDLTKWSFKFQASSTDIGETPEWKDLTHDPSAMCFAHEDKTVIFVDHFTLFNVTGELAGAGGGKEVESRRFRMGVFAESLFTDTETFQLRVRFWQDNDKEEQRAQAKERQLAAIQLSDDKVLHLAGDGGNVCVVLEWLFPGWRVTSGDRQTIPFSRLWNDYAEMPSCTFGLEREPTEPPPGRVACRVTALQAAHPGNSVSIDVLKQLCPRQSTNCERLSAVVLGSDLCPESTFLQLQPELHPTPRCIPQFPDEEQFGRLCLELDLENPAGKDWRGVAEALHLPSDFIRWTGQKKDPTRRLLDFLVALHKEDSLRVLRDSLAKVGHERALQMVEAMMGTSGNGPAAGAGVQHKGERQQSSDGQPFAGMWHDDDNGHGTAPKEVQSLSAYSPNTGGCNVNNNGPLPSQTKQPLSNGSTTVEKVSGERSLGAGQEADTSMPSTRSVATGSTSQVSPAEGNNNSVTTPKGLQIQANGYYSDYSLNHPGILDGGRGMRQPGRSALSLRVAQK